MAAAKGARPREAMARGGGVSLLARGMDTLPSVVNGMSRKYSGLA